MGRRSERYRRDPAREAFLNALNGALKTFDVPGRIVDPATADLPVIYIVGAQRSGTTLLSQLISRFYAVGYVSNMIAAFWDKPLAGILLSEALLGQDGRRAITFRSKHGVTPAVEDPHEFGYFWRRWLPVDRHPTHALPDAARRAVDVEGLGRVLREEMLAAFGRPLVFKNVLCGFHPDVLVRAHSRSLFVDIVRDEEATAASILQTRLERFGDYEAWWSMKPPTYPGLLRPGDPAAEVVAQIRDCRQEIAVRLDTPGVARLQVSYEAMCADPRGVLASIAARVETLYGVALEPIDGEWPRLDAARPARLPPALAFRLHALTAK